MNQKINELDDTPEVPLWGDLYAPIFWGLLICQVYLLFFVNWYSCLVPALFVQPVYRRVKKYRLPLIPFQKRLGKRLEKYQRFVVFCDLWHRSFIANRGLMVAGIMLMIGSLIVLSVAYNCPVFDLKDMIKISGMYLSSKELPDRNPCGAHYLISFQRKDGTNKTLWKGFYTGSWLDIRNLEMNKSDPRYNWLPLTVWATPNTRALAAECRNIPHIMQILGPNIEIRYIKEYAIEANGFFYIVFLFLAASGGYCIFRALWNNRQPEEIITS